MWPPPKVFGSFWSQNLTKTQPAWLLSAQPWIGNPPVPPNHGNQRVINETSNEISVEFWDAGLHDLAPGIMLLRFVELCLAPGNPQKKYEAYLVTSGVFKGVWADEI